MCSALLIDLALYATVADRLPDRLAVHFDAGGSANGYTSARSYLLYTLASLLVLGALWVFIAVRAGSTAAPTGGSSAEGSPRPRSSAIC